MGEQAPIIDGHVKLRDGKKWKARFARITRLSPVADCMTLQLWRDGRETEKGLSPTKGSINLSDYLGVETSFNLDKESHTMALIFREMVILLALPSREILIKWQVRLTSQFEEGQQFPAHLVAGPKKGKLALGPVKLHLQNGKFSMTVGIPPVLLHTWSMIDLRRFGAVDGGRFCFEGGTRCGKGEGLHVFRVDNPEELQVAFELSTKGRLENRKQRAGSNCNFAISHSPSVASSLSTIHRSGESGGSGNSSSPLVLNSTFGSVRSREELQRQRSRSRSRSMNTSCAWSSLDGGLALSSPDTLSLTLSEADGLERPGGGGAAAVSPSDNHLVSRQALLSRIGLGAVTANNNASHNSSRSCGSESDFCLGVGNQPRRQGSLPWPGAIGTMDRMSCSSGDSASSTYDQPKTVLKVVSTSSSPKALRRTLSSRPISPTEACCSPPLTPRSLRRASSQQGSSSGGAPDLRRMLLATPCSCDGQQQQQTAASQGAYDIPRNLMKQEAIQYYDTPRSIREAMLATQTEGMGNYDIPTAPVPVFTKPCGCVMKLTPGNSSNSSHNTSLDSSREMEMTWTCIREGSVGSNSSRGEGTELCIPRVKLTGIGRMPVVDMSMINARCPEDSGLSSSRPLSPSLHTGMAALSPATAGGMPLYAQIDRSKKAGPQPTQHQNYTNLDFANSLNLYENSRDVLSRLQPAAANSQQLRPQQQPSRNHSPQIDHDSLCMPQQQGNNYVRMSPRHQQQQQATADYEPMQFERGSSEETARGAEETARSAEETARGAEEDDDLDPLYSEVSRGNCRLTASAIGDLPTVTADTMSSSMHSVVMISEAAGAAAGNSWTAAGSCHRRSSVAGSDSSGAYNYDTVDSMDIMSDRFNTIKLMPKSLAIREEDSIQPPDQLLDSRRSKHIKEERGCSQACCCRGDNTSDQLCSSNSMLQVFSTTNNSEQVCSNGGSQLCSSVRGQSCSANSQLCSNSSSQLCNNSSSSQLCSGYVTLPRSKVMSDNILLTSPKTKSLGAGSTVTMRRSASVPCKRDRDSISSGSDSGVSTGSPRQSTAEQLEYLQ